MSELPVVSIIIPAYNAEKFIDECLLSACGQTFESIEIVVVNDASTDNTARNVERWMERDKRIRLVDLHENKGFSGARNAGIVSSKGEFLCFLDSDDCLYPQAIELLMNGIRQFGADVCKCAFKRSKNFSAKIYKRVNYKVFDYTTAVRLALYQKVILNSCWGMVIRRNLVVDGGLFREGIWYEDLDSFYRFFEHAAKIAYISEPLYFYRDNANSFLSKWNPGRLDVMKVTDRLVDFFREKYPELENAALDRRFSAHCNMLILMKRNKIDAPQAMARCKEVIRDTRKLVLSDGNVRLKNKIGALLSYLFI